MGAPLFNLALALTLSVAPAAVAAPAAEGSDLANTWARQLQAGIGVLSRGDGGGAGRGVAPRHP